MAILTKPSKHAFYTEGETLTEQEHSDSCDINKMILSARRGQQIRGGSPPQYGYDDMTMDGVQHRIKKAQIERELSSISSENEFDEKILDKIPESVKQKFKFKKKAKNDDKTTINGLSTKEPEQQPLPNPPDTPPKAPA